MIITKKRSAFTMIELIFVIVILGILAAVSVPKLAATRNDAKIAKEIMGASIALENLGATFTAKGDFVDYTVAQADSSVNCFVFTLQDATDGNVTLAIAPESTSCPSLVRDVLISKAEDKGLTNANGASKLYTLGGVGVKF